MNTVARLRGVAEPGEAGFSEQLYKETPNKYQHLEQGSVELRGKEEPVNIWVLKLG